MPDHDGARQSPLTPDVMWAGLDDAWQVAFGQAWEALRTGNIAVGACATMPDGTMVHSARNRVTDRDGPAGEVFGSSLAHAETNVLARLGFRLPRQFVLTTTLEPCIQCSAAIRLSPVAVARFAGADPIWDGCHDFSPLSPREAARTKVPHEGPMPDEVGAFGALISRFGPGMVPRIEKQLRAAGQGDSVDLAQDLETTGEVARLAAMDVREAFAHLYPRLKALRKA